MLKYVGFYLEDVTPSSLLKLPPTTDIYIYDYTKYFTKDMRFTLNPPSFLFYASLIAANHCQFYVIQSIFIKVIRHNLVE